MAHHYSKAREVTADAEKTSAALALVVDHTEGLVRAQAAAQALLLEEEVRAGLSSDFRRVYRNIIIVF